MNPLERFASWLWDRSGEKRRQQQLRLARGRRKQREHDAAHKHAAAQIRRTQEIAATIGTHEARR